MNSLSLTGGGYKSYFAQGIAKSRNWKYEKGKPRGMNRKDENSFGVSLLPSLGCVFTLSGTLSQLMASLSMGILQATGVCWHAFL